MLSRGGPSSSRMVPVAVPAPPAITALAGLDSVTVKVSVLSPTSSSTTATEIWPRRSPAGMDSLLDAPGS